MDVIVSRCLLGERCRYDGGARPSASVAALCGRVSEEGGRVMGVWLAEVAAGSPAPRASASHLEARWVPLADLAALPWIVADLPIVEAVVARCAR